MTSPYADGDQDRGVLQLRFRDAVLGRDDLTKKERYTGVEATFEIGVADRLVYREEYFLVVELCLAFMEWQAHGRRRRRHFVFESSEYDAFEPVETDDVGLVWLHPQPQGWTIGSIYQSDPSDRVLSDDEVRLAVDSYIRRVSAWLWRKAGVSADDL